MVRSDLGTFQLGGEDVRAFLGEVVPLLDGSRDRDGVARALPTYSRPSVLSVLELLERHGLLADEEVAPEGTRLRSRCQDEFLRAWPDAHAEAPRRVAAARVLAVGFTPWGRAIVEELAAAGVGAVHFVDPASASAAGAALAPLARRYPGTELTTGEVPSPTDARGRTRFDLVIGALPAGASAEVDELARTAHAIGLRSLWSLVDGARGLLGPVVVPGKTACRACAGVAPLNPITSISSLPLADPRAGWAARVLGHRAALEAIKLLSEYTPSGLVGRMVIQDFATLETSSHTLVRIPWCAVCGEGPAQDRESIGGPRVGV
jgi:bacteriocin biosynthesis cyclodehydratase domain-containing protein